MAYPDGLSYGPETRVLLAGTTVCIKDAKNLPPLPHITNNINALSRLFRDASVIGLPEQSVIKVLDFDEASAIVSSIAQAAKQATDTLIVYFAGHGLYGDKDAPLYLTARNTTSATKSYSAVNIRQVKRAMQESNARKRVLILDCCYSGRAFHEGLMGSRADEIGHDVEEIRQAVDLAGTYGIAACPGDAKATAPENAALTTFTQALVSVLETGVVRGGAFLTLGQVFDAVKVELGRAAIAPLPEAINWNGGSAFKLARNKYNERGLERFETSELAGAGPVSQGSGVSRGGVEPKRNDVPNHPIGPKSAAGSKGASTAEVGENVSGNAAFNSQDRSTPANANSWLNSTGLANKLPADKTNSVPSGLNGPRVWLELPQYDSDLAAYAILPDGLRAVLVFKRMRYGGPGDELSLWDIDSGKKIRDFEKRKTKDHPNQVAILPDGRRALVGYWGEYGSIFGKRFLTLYDIETGKMIHEFTGNYPVHNLALLSGGECALWTDGVRLAVADIAKKRTQRNFTLRPFETVGIFCVVPGDQQLLSVSLDRYDPSSKKIAINDLRTGDLIRCLEGHTDTVTSIAILANGRFAVSGSHDKSVRFWDLATGAELNRFAGHNEVVTAVLPLPDGRRVLSSSQDRTLRMWDLQSGKQLQCIELPIIRNYLIVIKTMTMLPDGKRVMSASGPALLIWDVASNE